MAENQKIFFTANKNWDSKFVQVCLILPFSHEVSFIVQKKLVFKV